MALWQFKIEIVPAERIEGRLQIERAVFDDARWWSDRQPPPDYRERFALLLPPTDSWDEHLLWYGREDGDRIDIWLEDGRVDSVGVRIDCRKANALLVAGLLKVIQEWSCSMVEKRYRRVLPNTLQEFVAAIAASPSCRFMEDPAFWLPKLAAEVEAEDVDKQ